MCIILCRCNLLFKKNLRYSEVFLSCTAHRQRNLVWNVIYSLTDFFFLPLVGVQRNVANSRTASYSQIRNFVQGTDKLSICVFSYDLSFISESFLTFRVSQKLLLYAVTHEVIWRCVICSTMLISGSYSLHTGRWYRRCGSYLRAEAVSWLYLDLSFMKPPHPPVHPPARPPTRK